MDRPIPTGPAAPDLRIVESRVYRGGNIWSYDPSIHLVVDLGVLEELPHRHPARLHRPARRAAARAGEPHLLQGGARRFRRAAARGHLARARVRARRTAAAAGGRARPAPRQDARRSRGSTGVYNVIYGYTNEDVGLAAGRLAVRLREPPGPGGGGLRLRRRARGLPDPGRAHRVRPVDRGHPRGGGQPRHPLHPAQQRQPGAARPGRAPAADPRHDDVEDRRAGRRHRGRQGHDHQAARFGGPAGAQAGDGALGRRRGRRRPADRFPRRRQAARRQPRSRRVPQPAERRRGAARRSSWPRTSPVAATSSSSRW